MRSGSEDHLVPQIQHISFFISKHVSFLYKLTITGNCISCTRRGGNSTFSCSIKVQHQPEWHVYVSFVLCVQSHAILGHRFCKHVHHFILFNESIVIYNCCIEGCISTVSFYFIYSSPEVSAVIWVNILHSIEHKIL